MISLKSGNPLWVVAASCVLGLVGAPAARAQGHTGYDPDLFRAWHWRNIGPNRGGRSIAVAGSSARPLEYYFGATGGGLWKSTDGGNTWAAVTDGQVHSASVGSIGVCATNPDIVYVGMGEGQFRAQMSSGDGVYGSRDGGKSWTHLGLASATGQQVVARLRVHPSDCDLVYAAVLGDPYGPSQQRGVYRSRDGGRSWQRVLFRNEHAGASDLYLDPGHPLTLYATIWDVVRQPWGGRTGETSGIFKSTDGGDTWSELTHHPGMPKVKIGKVGISASGPDPNRVYAVIEADYPEGGVFRSDDAGATWQRVNNHQNLTARAEYYNRIFADPTVRDRVYVLDNTFYRSDDGGRTYVQIRPPHGDNHDLWIDPANPLRMIESNDGGASVTVNGGRTWTDRDYPTAQLYHVAITTHFPYHVCGAQQDNGTACVPSNGDGSYWYDVAGGESGYIAADPRNPNIVYAGNYRGQLTRYDRSTGQVRSIDVWPENVQGRGADAARERFQWTFPIAFSAQTPDVLYVSSQYVWRTRNAGQTWERISPDLTYADPATLKRSQLIIRNVNSQDYYATVFALAPSRHDAGTLWAGSDDGLVHVTRDGGATWQKVTPPEVPKFSKVSLIEASPHAPGKAYLAVERYKIQDVAPYIFRTNDFGRTWTKIVTGIPADAFVRAVREDPVRPGLVFAGTEHGPYVSFDDGANWQSLTLTLPDVQVSDLQIRGNDLVISTFGRSFYVLDDLSPMRDPDFGRAPQTYLFKPADVVRTAAQATEPYRDAAVPGRNQAAVFYYLARPARQVAIEFLDGQGGVIRRFTGAQGVPPRALLRDSLQHVIPGQDQSPPVGTGAGLNRFVWDLRYPPVTSFPGMLIRGGATGEGPMGPPGRYAVRLTVDGASQTQTFTIAKDPRLEGVSQAALEAQFAFAIQVHRRVDEATSAVALIRDLTRQVQQRTQEANDREIATVARRLGDGLSAVEETLYEVGAQSDKSPLHLGGRLINQLGTVSGVVRSADERPTDQDYEVFQELSGQLGAQLSALDALLVNDLGRLNGLLRAKRLAPIEVARRANAVP